MVSETKYIGFKRDRFEVISYSHLGEFNKHYWNCLCSCGNKFKLHSQRIKKGTKSCGCLRKEQTKINRLKTNPKHGLHKHQLYTTYYGMYQRCHNPKNIRYKYYGGKGIKVFWTTFIDFYTWSIENGFKEGLSIDRIDSEKDYGPDNCQWITISENSKKTNAIKTRRDDGTWERRTEEFV